jgi:hypothetical protein
MNAALSKTTMAVFATGLLATIATPSFAYNSWDWNHPRRAEVLRRDAALNHEINCDAGCLHGHYGQLKAEDRAIRNQEQWEARMNGGFITSAQQRQLNREENALQRQISFDHRF